MNQKQQELYEKLLKKVNEYCLGYAAEDVIAAIDDLVDTYESRVTEADGYATQYSEALEIYRKRMNEFESGHSVDFSKVRFELQNLLPDPADIVKKLKALEIIKKHKLLNYVIKNPKCASMYHLNDEEIEQLKEIKNERTN